MKVLAIAEDYRNQILPFMVKASEKLGSKVEVSQEEFTGDADFSKTVLRLETYGPEPEPVPVFLKKYPDTEMLMVNFCPIGSEAMDLMPNLRVIGVTRGGVENVNVKAATERGIAVINAPGRNANAVSDYAVGMMLSAVRSMAPYHQLVMENGWQGKEYPGLNFDMFEKTIGLIGVGNIGRLVAKKLSGFDVNIIAYDPYMTQDMLSDCAIRLVDKETLFKESDVISIHARLTPESRHMIGAADIEMMKPTAYLVNTARSGLIDMSALLEALENGRIAGAALDVFDQEPLNEDSPFKKLKNVTLTPHVAGRTADALTGSPRILGGFIEDMLNTRQSRAWKNPEVLEHPDFKEWLDNIGEIMGR